jgi:adenosylmethionine-8-amino-7-oxononanoate aminotransferase
MGKEREPVAKGLFDRIGREGTEGIMDELNSEYLFYQTRKKLPVIQRAEGVYMWDREGKVYIDGCSGAVISNIGHGNPRIAQAITAQAESTFFAYRNYFENEPAIRLAQKLAENSAPHLNRVFYVSGGSEAVESAMKICRQYFYNIGEGSRYVFVSRTPSYHGSTLGALALTGYGPLEIPFRPLMQTYPKIPAPYCYRCAYGATPQSCDLACARELETVVKSQGPDNVVAFVAEPVTGASMGAVVPPEGYFSVIQEICKKYGIFLILDEVMTAFGRTGKLFGYQHWDVEADVVALSKGMASGYYPLGAIVTRKEIVDKVLAAGGFAHGHTYAGNPMACAVGLEVLHVILEDDLASNAAVMGDVLKAGLEELAERHPIVGDVRGIGLLQAVELVSDRETKQPFAPEKCANVLLTDEAFDEGLIVYPRRPIYGLSGDHVVVAPPLIVTEAEVAEILRRLDRALGRVAMKLG